MKRIALLAVALGVVLALGVTVYAQCGTAGCSTPAQVVHVQHQPGYRWVPVPDAPDQDACYFGNLQVGAYNFTNGFYRPIIGGKWGAPSKAPIPPRLTGGGDPSHGYSFGVTTSHLTGRERFWSGGDSYSRGQYETMLGAELRDDSKAGHVTAVAKNPVDAKKFLADWQRAREKDPRTANVRFQACDFSNPVVREMLAPNQLERDSSFNRTGVVVLAQHAADPKTGKSPAKAIYDYTGEETLIEAVRTIDPNYDPNKSPLPKIPGLPNVPAEAYLAAGVAGLVGLGWIRRRRAA